MRAVALLFLRRLNVDIHQNHADVGYALSPRRQHLPGIYRSPLPQRRGNEQFPCEANIKSTTSPNANIFPWHGFALNHTQPLIQVGWKTPKGECRGRASTCQKHVYDSSTFVHDDYRLRDSD